MIIASPPIIEQWRQEAAAAFTAANRPCDPALFDQLAAAPREVIELVAALSGSLARAAAMLRVSAESAVPSALEALQAGLANLTREVHAQQAGEASYVCPMPTLDGGPFRCDCPVPDRCDPALAYASGMNPGMVDGEVDLEHPNPDRRLTFEQSSRLIEERYSDAIDLLGKGGDPDQLDADLEQVAETDRAARDDEDGPR
jgi:hypothetical protein